MTKDDEIKALDKEVEELKAIIEGLKNKLEEKKIITGANYAEEWIAHMDNVKEYMR